MNNEIYRTFTFVNHCLKNRCRSSHVMLEYLQVHGIHHNFGLYPQPQAPPCLMYAAHHEKKTRRRMSLDIIHDGTGRTDRSKDPYLNHLGPNDQFGFILIFTTTASWFKSLENG